MKLKSLLNPNPNPNPSNPEEWKLIRKDIPGRVVPDTRLNKVAEWDAVDIQKIFIAVEGRDVDVQLMVDEVDVGVNIGDLEEAGITDPNGDWYLSRVDAAVAPPIFYLLFIPDEFIANNVRLRLLNNEPDARRILHGHIIYRVPQGGGRR